MAELHLRVTSRRPGKQAKPQQTKSMSVATHVHKPTRNANNFPPHLAARPGRAPPRLDTPCLTSPHLTTLLTVASPKPHPPVATTEPRRLPSASVPRRVRLSPAAQLSKPHPRRVPARPLPRHHLRGEQPSRVRCCIDRVRIRVTVTVITAAPPPCCVHAGTLPRLLSRELASSELASLHYAVFAMRAFSTSSRLKTSPRSATAPRKLTSRRRAPHRVASSPPAGAAAAGRQPFHSDAAIEGGTGLSEQAVVIAAWCFSSASARSFRRISGSRSCVWRWPRP